METLIDEAFTEIKKMPESDQEAIAALIFEEILAERKWEKLFAESGDVLSHLAEEALTDYRTGRTNELSLSNEFTDD